MRITFLVGSGVSIPAGFPTTVQLTDQILRPPPITRHTDGTYYLGQPPEYSQSTFYVERVNKFLDLLREEIDTYYNRLGQRFNYEHLFYVAKQIEDGEFGELDNPVVPAFLNKLDPEIGRLLRYGPSTEPALDLGTLARETTNYIADLVWRFLTKPPINDDYLRVFSDACRDPESQGVSFFTVNHDTLLETFLRQCGIELTDGFSAPVNGVRYWNPDSYESAVKVRFFKLHGSIDWFRLRPNGADWSQERIGIPLNGDPWHTKSPEGGLQTPLDGRPLFLVGTFNKIHSYTSGIFHELHSRLYRELSRVSTVCVVGYGFGDKGINSAIIEWLYAVPGRKLIVAHGSPDTLIAGARGAISSKWDSWIRESRLIVFPQWVEGLEWEQLRAAFVGKSGSRTP